MYICKNKFMDITKINGYEIIDFLNNLPEDSEEELSEYNLYGPFEFTSQGIQDNVYHLDFSCYVNNWGKHQIVEHNQIKISKDMKVWVSLDEPLEGSGVEDSMSELLSSFITNHSFDDNVEDKFFVLIEECRNTLNSVSYSLTVKESLSQVIEKLSKANSMIK